MANNHGAHQTREAYVVSLCEDFCKSPSAPVGYMISQKLDMSTLVCGTVNGCGTPVLNMSSRITKVTGNEAGIGGGVVSGVNVGMCKPIENYAPKVRAEGQYLLRHDTIMEMNTSGPMGMGNVRGKIVHAASSSSPDSSSCIISQDGKEAIKHIQDAMKESKGDVGKATGIIEKARRASQEASNNKGLIYAHYWLKGSIVSGLGDFGRGLGVIYLWTKKRGIKFDKLAQVGVSKWEPSPYDAETEKWYLGGTLGKVPCS